jgi:hypothetical protein
MTRFRERSPEGTYLVSSYVTRTELDLGNKPTKKLLKKIILRAQKIFGFKFCKLQIQKNAFSMFITPPKGDEEKISEVMQAAIIFCL